MSDNAFRFGDWQIDPDSNTLRSEGATSTIEPKAMDVLRYLCRHAGAVIPPEELLQACWGNAELGDNPIHKAITQLRRALGDSASEPRYIETVRKRGYRAIAPVVTGEAALDGSWQQGSPFRGLESFQESHAAIFFGRLQATAQLRELVLNQTSAGCAMALVLGPSGSGKTSLVRAGLLPGLMASRTGSGEPVALACTLYMDCADLADGNLFQALAAVLMDAEVGGQLQFSGENAEELGRWLESADAAVIAGRFAEIAGRIKIGLFVDRLEAIFRAPGVTDDIRLRFIAVLEHLARSRAVLVMLACRNDFYPEVIALPALMALKSRGGHFDLNPPDGAEIAQMVRMPARAAGLKFEVDPATGAALDDVLCDAARGSPDTLPLLQYCLDELYRQRGEDGTLRFEVFNHLGGIEGAIAVRAEQVVASLSSTQSLALHSVLALIVDVSVEQGAVTARRAAWSSLPDNDARSLVQALVEARLFVSELSGDVPSFGLAHEALLRRWPRVSAWIEDHRHAIQLRTQINQEAEKWAAAGKPKDLLLPAGTRINQAIDLLDFKRFTLPSLLIDYIKSSRERVRRGKRIRLAITLLIGLLAISAAVLGLFAHRAQQTSELRRGQAENLISYMLGDFADKIRPIGKLELLDGMSAKALTYLLDPELGTISPAVKLQRAKALQVIAEVSIARVQQQRALDALTAARKILSSPEHTPSKEFYKIAGANAFWLGQLKLNSNQLNEAKPFFNEYLAFSNKIVTLGPNDVDGWIEQAYAYSSLGTLALKQNEQAAAQAHFLKAMELKRKAQEFRPEDATLAASLANNYSWLAESKVNAGLLKEGLEYYQEMERQLTKVYSRDTTSLLWKFQLGVSMGHQGELLNALGNQTESINKLKLAESYLLDITNKDNSNRSWKITLYNIQLKLVDAGTYDGNQSEKLKKISSINEHLMDLRKAEPSRSNLAILALLSQQYLIEAQYQAGNASAKLLAENRSELKDLLSKNKSDLTVNTLYANSFLLQAMLPTHELDENAKNQACTLSQGILEPLATNTNNYRLLSTLARSYHCSASEAAPAVHARLKSMGYQNKRYLQSFPPTNTGS